MRQKSIYLLLFLLINTIVIGQNTDKKSLEKELASNHYALQAQKQQDFIEQEFLYRKALAKDTANSKASYNLANSYFKNKAFSEAFSRYKKALQSTKNKAQRHSAFHNIGNVFMRQKDYEKAVAAYKDALRNNPKDEQTRYNLALAKELLKKQQQQNKDNQDKKDQKDKENQDKKDQDKEDQKDKENQDKKDQDKQDQKDKENQDKKDQDKEDQKDKENQDKKDQDKQDQKDKENQDKKDQDKEDQKDKENQDKKDQDKQGQKNQNTPATNTARLSAKQIEQMLKAMEQEENKVQQKINAKKVQGTPIKNEKDW